MNPASRPGKAIESELSIGISASARGEGADKVSFIAFKEGAGVDAVENGGLEGAGTDTTMICSPRVMGMVARVSEVLGSVLGG